MPAPAIDDVRPLLRDFELRIRKVLEGAWKEDWLTLPERHRSLLDKTARANCVFCFAKHRGIAEFMNDDNVRVIPSGRTVKYLFRDRVLARLKKANRSGLGSNIATQATIEFVNPQIPLFELPEIYRIEVVYEEDTLATRIQSVAAACRQGLQKIWSYELEVPTAAVVTQIPPATMENPLPPVVKPREVAKQPENASED